MKEALFEKVYSDDFQTILKERGIECAEHFYMMPYCTFNALILLVLLINDEELEEALELLEDIEATDLEIEIEGSVLLAETVCKLRIVFIAFLDKMGFAEKSESWREMLMNYEFFNRCNIDADICKFRACQCIDDLLELSAEYI